MVEDSIKLINYLDGEISYLKNIIKSLQYQNELLKIRIEHKEILINENKD